jgi:ribonuclease HII
VIGPLVIAGVGIEFLDSKCARCLMRLGVRDSKALSPRSRAALAELIERERGGIGYAEAWPELVDGYVLGKGETGGLNRLEALLMAKVIGELGADLAYVDASDINPDRFRGYLEEGLGGEVGLICEHHADRKYPIVSAASILAKVRRDEAIEGLKEEYGDFGSGYASDPKTISFLRSWLRAHGEAPPIARRSWRTVWKARQRRLDDP